MRQIMYDFLDSDMTEAEFFDFPKDDLISLREYLLGLEEKDKEFMNLIKEPSNSIKDKCPWVSDLAFNLFQQISTGEYISSNIWLFPTKGHELIIKKDRKTEQYKDIAERIPKIYLLSGKIREHIKRQGDLGAIQEELREIDQIGCNFYDGLLHHQSSISGNFKMYYFPNVGMEVFGEEEVLAYYYARQMKTYEKPYLNDENKSKVLTRIQIKKPKEKTREI